MTLPAPAALLFDLDGVLIDSYLVWFHLLNAAAQTWGYPAISEEVFRDAWGQGIQADQARFYPRQQVAEIDAFYTRHFEDHIDRLRVPSGVPEIFAALEQRHVPSAVITNTPNPLAATLVERAGATPESVIGGTDVPRPKPAPDMVLHAARALGVAPERVWVIGDSAYDRDAARAAGAVFVGIGIAGDATLGGVRELVTLVEAALASTKTGA